MPPPLYNDQSEDSSDATTTTPPVVTGPATAPLVSTGGVGTVFADPGDLRRYQQAKARGASEAEALKVGDNGIGSPHLGTIDTTKAYGIAAPEEWLRKTFGDDPAAWRKARGVVTIGDKTITVPFVDIGPGKGPREKGVVADLTHSLWQGLGLKDDNPNVTVKFLGDSGPDYATDRQAWDQEQQQIGTALQTPMALASASPTPMARFAEGGIVTQPTVALLGEKGPEAVVPLSGQPAFGAISSLGQGLASAQAVQPGDEELSALSRWFDRQ